MKTRIFLVTALGVGLMAGGAHAQSLLEGLAQRALTSAAGEVLGRAVAGRVQGAAPAPSEGVEPSAAAPRSSRSRPSRDDAPEAEGMQGLSPEDRSRACAARYPTQGLEGDAYMQRSSQHGACMGPGWGEGG